MPFSSSRDDAEMVDEANAEAEMNDVIADMQEIIADPQATPEEIKAAQYTIEDAKRGSNLPDDPSEVL